MKICCLLVSIVFIFSRQTESINTISISFIQSSVNQAINDGLDVCQHQVQFRYPVVYQNLQLQSFSFKILSEIISYHLVYFDKVKKYDFDLDLSKVKWTATIKNLSISKLQTSVGSPRAQSVGVIILNVTKLNSELTTNNSSSLNNTPPAENNQQPKIAFYQNGVAIYQNLQNNSTLVQDANKGVSSQSQIKNDVSAAVSANVQKLFNLSTNT